MHCSHGADVALPDKQEEFPQMKCIRKYVYNGPLIILVLVWDMSIHSRQKYVRKTIFCILASSDLDLWPLDLKFVPSVTLVQRYVSTQLEFLRLSCLEIIGGARRTDRGTDGRGASATLNAASREGHIITTILMLNKGVLLRILLIRVYSL